jgi:imidazole glycerol-phosphate synthase subunit HisF
MLRPRIKEVDELIVLDIDATAHSREPDYAMIASLAAECRMPLCYGGGVKNADQVQRIVSLGVEKVAISAAALAEPSLISVASTRVGRQSVVVVLDVRRHLDDSWEVFTHNGNRATGQFAEDCARRAELLGAGEIVVNNIDRDGAMKGYDVELACRIRNAISLPMTILGGAGSLDDISNLLRQFGIVGAAAGSLFVFRGIYRAVLINYPNRAAKDHLVAVTRTR